MRYRFQAVGDAWLYDAHGQRFASLGGGATATTGFAPLFLSLLFGVPVARWSSLLDEVVRAGSGPEFDRLVDELKPVRSLSAAAEMALLAYPAMERFVARLDGPRSPFGLRPEFLHQPNVELGPLEELGPEGWRPARARMAARPLGRRAVAEGVYAIGHSGLLIRGGDTGLLIDPIPLSRLVPAGALDVDDLAASATAVALTHGHFDHYHLPSLLALGGRPILTPPVPLATIVCEHMPSRLAGLGLEPRVAAWGELIELGDLRVHVLPFVGEQFLSSEEHPALRNWGSAYVVETPRQRVLVAADCGFEPGRSILDVTREHVESNGAVDVLAVQGIALRTTFGGGDPDLQLTALTCPHRAAEAFELLAMDRRVTLSADDVAELAEVSGANAVLLYGQFSFVLGEPCVSPQLVQSVRGALRERGLGGVLVPALVNGEGVMRGERVRLVVEGP